MKTNTPKNLFYTVLLSVFFIGMSINGHAQCGAESITPTPWCENGFAKYTFTAPTSGASYYWYSYTPAPYTPADFDSNGKLIRTGTVFYDSTTLASYTSIFRLTTATAPPGGLVLTYIKRVDYNDVNPSPATAPAFVSRPATTPFEMNFNVTSIPVRIETVRVPVVLNTPGQAYKIQIAFGSTAGPGSAVYNFSTVDAVKIGATGNNYYIDVPVNYTITTLGANKMVVNTNPTGSSAVVDGLLFSPSASPAATITQGPITIPAGSGSSPAAGSFANIFNWDYYSMCGPQQTPASIKTTVGCCVPPTSINALTLTSSKQSIVSGTETTVLAVNNAEAATNYFSWYLNGIVQSGLSGIGKTSNTVNQAGVWEVRELKAPPTPSATDINNPSCYAIADVDVQEKKIFATITSSPTNSPACIGDSWTIAASGSTNYSWSTSGGTLSNTTGSTTTFTATAAGSTKVIVTGDIISNNLVVNGDFTAGATSFTSLQIAPTSDLRNDDGGFAVANTAGTWGAQPDWTFNAARPFVTGNPGNFLILNGEDASTISKPLVWGQKVSNLSSNQNYTFSFDLTSICYVVSSNTSGYSNAPGTAPFYDVQLEIYINGVLVGSASTDFALNGGTEAVGKWKNHTYTWNSGTAASAAIEIRQKSVFPGRGYDFGLDNVKFGGLQTQTAEVAIGPIIDCSSITAVASPCTNDVQTTLTATVGGGLIFDHWELASNPNVSVSSLNPYTVNSVTPTTYVAVGYLPSGGNLLANGDFNAGNVGFISGAPTYYDYIASSHGDNKYSVDNNITPYNSSWWINIPQAPGEPANSLRFFTDAKTQSKVIAWTFTAAQNQKFVFNGYMANIHSEVTGDTVNSGIPAAVGIYINNTLVASYWSKNDRNWHLMSGQWTAPLAGTNSYTLEVRNLKLNGGGGNDFALDNFKLQALSSTAKKASVITPDCNPCTKNLPTLGTPNTFCVNTGIVHLTPNASEPTGIFDWYTAATAGTKLGTSQGIDPDGDTLNVSTVPLDMPAGTKTVWYQKSAKGAGTVYRRTQSCDPTFQVSNYDQGNIGRFTQEYTASKPVNVTGLSFNLQYKFENTLNVAGTVTFTVYGAKYTTNGSGGYVPDNTINYGTLSKNFTGTSTTTQTTVFKRDSAIGNVAVPAGRFFIVATSIVRTSPGDGQFGLGMGNCNQPVPVVDNLDGVTVSRTGGSSDGTPNPTSSVVTGFAYDVKFSLPAYPCPRVAVTLTPSCPCTPPTSVAITPTTQTLCAGANLTIAGTVTLSATAPTGAYQYTWYKGTYSVANIVSGPSATYSDFTKTGVAAADAGTYTLRVEDYTSPGGNSACYKEASVVITVNAITVPGAIAAAQTICAGGDPAAFTVTTAASGGNGTTYAYQWAKSINGATPYTDITGATNSVYDEAALANATTSPITVDYQRKVTSGVCPQVTTAAIRITVNPTLVAGAVAADQTVCSTGDPAAFTQTTAATGGSGTYTYQWQSASAVAGTYTNITSATNATYDPPTGIAATTFYRRVDASGTCTAVNTNVITVTVPVALVAGTVTANQTICYNTIPAAFASTAAATGGNGTFAYQWQISATSGGVFTNIAGETNATYTPTVALTSDKYYRRQVTSGTVSPCNVAVTAELHVTVSPNFVVGSIGGTQTVCQTGNPTNLTSATLPTGGQTAYTYQWQSSSTTGTGFSDISGATTSTYDPPAGIAATTYFRRVDKSAGNCGTLNTNEIIVTVTPTVVPDVTIATPSTTICSGESITFTATPTNGGTPTYQWRKNSVNIASATNATYTTTGAANTDSYDVIMTSTANCASPLTKTSNAIAITVTTVVTPAVTITAAPTGAICDGASVTFTASPGNGGTGPKYQWKVNGSNIAGATNVTFTSATLANGNTVSVDMISNSGCASTPNASSNVITMVVDPIPTPSVSASVSPTGAICDGASLTFTAAPTLGGTTPKYQWKKGGAVITGATNATYITTTAANNDSYTVEMISNARCAPTTAVASTAIVVTVNPILVPSVTISANPTTICTNGSVTFTAAPTNGGAGPTYQWYVKGSPVGAATNVTFTTTALTLSTDQVEVRLLSNALCANPLIASASTTVTVNLGIGAGTVGSDQVICYGTIPAALTQTAAPTSIVGTPTYQWEAAASASGTFTAIPGATNIGYTPTLAITQDVYVRRVITDPGTPAPCNKATSNAVYIKVNPQLVAGTVGADQTICSATIPAAMNQTTAPTGGTGTYTYQWQSDASGSFQNISGATNSSYTSTALTTTTSFKRVETSGTCGSVTSNVVIKTVTSPEVVTVSINDPGQVCAGSAAFNFVATASSTGTGTLTYVWSKTNPLTGVVTVVGTNSSSYSYSPVAGDDNFVIKVVVTTSTGCNAGPATSNLVTLDIVGATTPTVTISTLNNPNCAGYPTTFTLASTGGGNNPTYQWYKIPFGSATPQPVGTGVTYTTSTLLGGDQIYVELTSSLGCIIGTNPFPSNKILMNIKQVPAPSITEGDQTICSPNTFTFHGNVTVGNTYEWRLNGTTVVGTNPDFTATQSGTYTLFEDNGICNTISQPVVLTIVQTPQANAGTDMYLKEGASGNLNGSGGSVYNWTPSTYLSNAAVSNPSFTATTTITYILTVSAPGNPLCATSDDVTVFVVKPIEVPNVITVNGDGSNDDWEIKNIEGYPNAIIEIYNRWGNLVWKSEGYPKNWDGTNYRNGEVLADGTYFYIINLKSTVYAEPLTGWIQIMK